MNETLLTLVLMSLTGGLGIVLGILFGISVARMRVPV